MRPDARPESCQDPRENEVTGSDRDERIDPADVAQRLQAASFPHAVTRIDRRETHISWVILTGEFAYKIKKPVRFDFLDATSLENRRRFCEEEVRLNRRTAPGLYLGVVPITREADGQLKVGGSGAIIDHAVQMRQFQAADELAALLDSRSIELKEITELAASLAAFHGEAAIATSTSHEHTGDLYDAVLGNLADVTRLVDPHAVRADIRQLVGWTLGAARSLKECLVEREGSGFVRDCHGDLHAGNIVRWQGALVPFDCIEFDPGLRLIDVMNDLAFLVMDLVSRQRWDLGFALLSRYFEITGDYEGLRLLPFYAVYRALVRAKVDALAAETLPGRAAEFEKRRENRLAAALHWSKPGTPTLILMHGVSGSGKSWLSERLIPAIPAIRIRSDVERKRLAGVAGEHHPAEYHTGLYSPRLSHRTYARLVDCAGIGLEAGCNVIVDATFLRVTDRELFQNLSRRLGANYAIVSCTASPAVLEQRIATRSSADPSDATPSLVWRQLETAEPFSGEESAHVITVDTGKDVDVVIGTVRHGLAALAAPAGSPRQTDG